MGETMNARGQSAIKSPLATTRTLRGQSAMEFLMTYGWAVLVMLVIVAVLFYIGVFSPGTAAPNACHMPAGFSCYGYVVYGDGSMVLDLGQATGKDIRVLMISCTAKDAPSDSGDISPNQLIQNGRHYNFTGAYCTLEDGTSTPSAGDFYRGSIYVDYVEDETNIPHRIVGDIAYKVEKPV